MYRQSEKNFLNSDSSSRCPDNMVNFGPLTAEIYWQVWGTSVNFNGFHVLAALLHGTLVVGVSQTLRCWTDGATYIQQGGHHVGHWPTFLVIIWSAEMFYLLTYWLLVEHVGLISAAVASQGLKEGDLVMLTLRRPMASSHCPSDAVNSLPPERRVFGYIKQTQRCSMRSREQLHPLISESDIDNISCVRQQNLFFVELLKGDMQRFFTKLMQSSF